MLDQFCRTGIRGQEDRMLGLRAIRMHGALETLSDNRFVNLAQQFLGPRRVDSNHDAVGMQKIFDRGSFPQKLGIRGDVVVQASCTVHGEMFPELRTSLHWYRALFD